MKICCCLVCLIFSLTLAAKSFFLLGKYQNVTVKKVTLSGIHISHDEGESCLKVDELSELERASLAEEVALYEALHKKKKASKQRKNNRLKLKLEQEKELEAFLKDIKTLTEPKLLQWLKKYNSTPDNFTALKRYFAYASNRDQVIKAIMMRFATFENEYLQKIADKCKNKSYDEINKVLISHFNLDIDKCTDEFLKKKFTKATKLDDFIKMLADTREAEKKRKERKANLSSSSSSFFGMSSGSFSMHSRHGTAAVYGVKGQEYLKYCPNCGGKGQLTKVDMGNLYDLNNNTARTYQIQCPDCRGTGRIR